VAETDRPGWRLASGDGDEPDAQAVRGIELRRIVLRILGRDVFSACAEAARLLNRGQNARSSSVAVARASNTNVRPTATRSTMQSIRWMLTCGEDRPSSEVNTEEGDFSKINTLQLVSAGKRAGNAKEAMLTGVATKSFRPTAGIAEYRRPKENGHNT
jgi:hypothetical protein